MRNAQSLRQWCATARQSGVVLQRGLLVGGLSVGLLATLFALASAQAAENETYTLRYHFRPHETMRWEVNVHTEMRTTVSGKTECDEMRTKSGKVWRVTEVKPDGAATFVHSVEWVDLWRQLGDCAPTHFDTRTSAKPPQGFENLVQSVGVPLSTVTMDATGKILQRARHKVKAAAQNEGNMTIPLPSEPIAIGYKWSQQEEIDVPLETGGMRKVKTLQQFRLESVKTGVALIRVSTTIITPISNPALESKLLQHENSGWVRFDIDAGRIISQQMDIDKRVVGFRGQASSIRYVNRFTETLQSDGLTVAEHATASAN